MSRPKRTARTSPLRAALLASATLTGCAVGPDYVAPEINSAAVFANAEGKDISTDSPEVRWWTLFQDPQLTGLVNRAVENNLELEVALARIRVSRALRTESVLNGLPIVTSNASYTNNQISSASLLGLEGGDAVQYEFYDVGFDATWEIDLFGRVRRNIEANTARLGASIATRRDVIVSLIAEVARNYLELRGLQQQVEIARRNAATQQNTYDLTDRLLQAGRGTELDTSRSRAQYLRTQAVIPPLEAALKRNIHRIAVLLAVQPQELYAELLPPKPLPTTPIFLCIGDPGQLLRRRPDIQTAERELHARTADIGVATADYFPRVAFNGNVALQANVISALGGPGSAAWAFGPYISWAAFDLGRVEMRVRQTDALAYAQLATFKQTVLLALEETENALVDYASEKSRAQTLAEASQMSQKAATIAGEQFNQGLVDFLSVLDAQQTMLVDELELVRSQTNTATNLVEVYKSLGGGWEAFPILPKGKTGADLAEARIQ